MDFCLWTLLATVVLTILVLYWVAIKRVTAEVYDELSKFQNEKRASCPVL